MAKCVLLCVGSLLVLVVAAEAINGLASVAEEQPEVGHYEPIDVSEPKIKELARLVVKIHNWQKGSHLQLEEVMCGWSQRVAGTNYEFCLSVFDGNAVVVYRTNVFVGLDQNIIINDFYPYPGKHCCIKPPEDA